MDERTDVRRSYEQGIEAGRIEARLEQYDLHFNTINGSIAETARQLRDLVMAVQRLSDQAVARDATVIATAAALKEAEATRRARSDQTWSPIQRILAVIAGLGVIVGAIVAARTFLH